MSLIPSRLATLLAQGFTPTLFALTILVGLAMPAGAQDLNVYMTASSEVVGPGDRTTFMLTATNTGAVDLTNVSADVELPASINRLSFPPPGFSCSVGCDANETATWTIGTLAPGNSRTVFYQAQIQGTASAGTITSSLTASATGASNATASLDIEIDDSPLLRLNVTPESGPATAGEPFTYTLVFGNVGSTSPSNVVLTMPIPNGTTFVSATDGGTESSGTVTWNLGQLGVGQSGQVQLTLTPNASLDDGRVVEAEAVMDPNEATEPVARSSAHTPVGSEEPLRIEYGISQTATGANDPVTYTLTATNTGPVDLTDASARILFPGFISRITFRPPAFSCSVGCDANEVATWTIGTLAPGESRTAFFRTFLQSSAPQGEVTQTLLAATSSNTGQVTAALGSHVDPSPLLRLNLAAQTGQAVPGGPLTYTATMGNVGNKNPTDVVLRMPVPEGTTFVSASDGGNESGGIVTWNIGLLGVGNSRQVRVTVLPDAGLASGTLILGRSELDSGDAQEVVIRSSVVTGVREDVPLRMSYSLSQTASGQDDAVDVVLTATNTGPVDLTDASARILFPSFISRIRFRPPAFSCSVGCDANEVATWTIGTLAPGESRTAFFRTFITSGAPQGEISHSMFTAQSTGSVQIVSEIDVQVDPSPVLRLSLDPAPNPAVPRDSITYRLTLGNVGAKNIPNGVLTMPVPEGTSFEIATEGGGLQNGVVTWSNIPILGPGTGGTAEATFTVDGSLAEGSQVHAEATVDPGDANEVVTRSSNTTVVRSGVPLEVSYTSDVSIVAEGDPIAYTLTVSNTGPVDLSDVSGRVLFPGFINRISPTPADFSCSVGCDANEVATWSVGTLAPGETRSVTFEPTVRDPAPSGLPLRSLAQITATGSNEVVVQRDVFLGVDTPLPVELTSFTASLEGEAVALAWSTATETNNTGFDVERSIDGETFTTIGFESGVGTTEEAQSYRFVDRDAPFATTLFYRLRQVDTDGTFEYSPVVEVQVTPSAVALLPVAPNPVVGFANLRYELPEATAVRLQVFDLLGRRVATLASGEKPAGRHEVTWTGSRLAPGTYFVRLEAGSTAQTQMLRLVR